MQLNINIIMDYFYIFLIVIYFILSLMNVSGAGPEYARKRQEAMSDDFYINSRRDANIEPEFVSAEYYYYTLLTFALIPFHTLTKDNRFYIVRLVGYLTDILYGGIGLIIWMIIYLTKNTLDALCDVFFKLKDL